MTDLPKQVTITPFGCDVSETYDVYSQTTSGSRGRELVIGKGGIPMRVCHAPDRRGYIVHTSGQTLKYHW